jgi:hypothetical protein
MAARVIRSAYDMDSLYSGGAMMEKIEEARLRELPPSGPWEDRAKKWPEQTRVFDNLRSSWARRLWLTSNPAGSVLPWLIPVFAFVSLLRVRSQLALPQTANAAKTPSALVMASVILVSLVVFMVACKWNLATGSGVILGASGVVCLHIVLVHKSRDRRIRRPCKGRSFVVANREFLLYGDEGIHAKVGQDFWNDVRDQMAQAFGRDAFGDRIAKGVRRIGEKPALHFPRRQDDVDEIPNEIVYVR